MNAISTFRLPLTKVPGFYSHISVNLKRQMQNKIKSELKSFSIGKPAVWGHHVVIGTDDPRSQDHYLMYLNCDESLAQNILKDPIASYIRVNERITDVKWITRSKILAASGNGRLQVFEKSGTLNWHSNIDGIHLESIREIATMPTGSNRVATGGYDQTVCFIDLNHHDMVQQRHKVADTIGSVKWPIWNSGICPSVGLDNGTYIMYDMRQAPAVVAFEFHSGVPYMWTHERYTDHHVLFGYSDGIIKHIDMRSGRSSACVISTATDPWCEGVGNIEFNYDKHSFVTSGYTGSTVWKQAVDNEVIVWSHTNGVHNFENENIYRCSSTWYDSDIVMMTNNEGYISWSIQNLL